MVAKRKKKKKPFSWKSQIVLIFVLLGAVAAMSTTVILAIGMLPTFVAFFIDRTSEKTRGLTVGAMNLAGCTPFILQLWRTNTSLDSALNIIANPSTVIVMYCAAGLGYVIDWAVSGLVGSLLAQRGASRRQQIEKRKIELIERWGREVTGELMVDSDGFPVESDFAQDMAKDTGKQRSVR